MSFLFFFILYNDGGHDYDSPTKETLIQVDKSTVHLTVCKEVVKIAAGSEGSSAFSLCKSVIRSVRFEEETRVSELGDFLFSGTTLETIDFGNCLYLKSIPIRCFQNCNKLSNVTLPPNIEIIKGGSFFSTNINYLEIPDSLTTIDDYSYHGVFQNCQSLKTIHFSTNSQLTKIGLYAFLNSGLKTFHIPQQLMTISTSSFAFCPLEEITCDQNNSYFATDGRAIYTKDFSILCCVSSFNFKEPFTIIEKVQTITSHAFRGTPGDTVIFKNPFVTFSDSAFYNTKIKNISLPEGQTKVISTCFSGSSVEYVFLPSTITKIELRAFADCNSLKEVFMQEGIKEIGTSAFRNCYNINLTIPATVTLISISCFTNVPIENIHFMNQLFEFDEFFFYYNNSLVEYINENENNEIMIPASVSSIPSSMFQNKKMKSVQFEEKSACTDLGSNAFYESTLESIVFPSSLETMGSMCFYSCKNLKIVELKGNLKTIPSSCFQHCDLLSTINFESCSSIITISAKAFYGCFELMIDFTQLVNLEIIDESAFFQTKSSIVSFPPSLKTIGEYCFSQSGVETIYFSSNLTKSSSLKTLFGGTMLEIVPSYCFSKCSKLKNFYSGNSPTVVDNFAFQLCSSLESFTLGKNIQRLEMYSFYECTKLVSIYIPENSKLSEIQGYAFSLTKLSQFIIANTSQFIFENRLLMTGDRSKIIYYIHDNSTKTFVIPSSVNEIGAYAFTNATSFWEVIMADGIVKTIGAYAFMDCINMHRIVTSKALEKINVDAFINCPKLLCGGVIMNPSLVSQAKDAGMSSSVLTPFCLNNYDALLRRPTCHKGNRFFYFKSFVPILLFALQ